MGGGGDKLAEPAPKPVFAPAPIATTTPTFTGGNSLLALSNSPAYPVTQSMTPHAWLSAGTGVVPPQVTDANTMNRGTFMLDPALAGQATPDRLSTQVMVAPPLSREGTPEPVQYVQLERPVHAALRLAVYAIRSADVYETWAEASADHPFFEQRTTLPDVQPGGVYWTPGGEITVLGTRDNVVFTAQPNLSTGAAGAVVLLSTDAGPVLIDIGMQTPDPTIAWAVGEELASLVLSHVGPLAIGEAIMRPGAPNGNALPYIAKQVRVLTLRATAQQFQDGSVSAVLQSQNEYRAWYEKALRAQLVQERATWEATQPIAPNDSIREQRWQRHVESALASALSSYQPPALAMTDVVGSVLEVHDDIAPTQTVLAKDEQGAIDLSDTEWEPAEDEMLAVHGDGKLALVPARGYVLRPAGLLPPAPALPMGPLTPPGFVPGLRPNGVLGPAMPAPRAVTPWLAMAAIGKEGQMLVRLAHGHGVLVDAGGVPRVMALDSLAALKGLLGIAIDQILITHPHKDHLRHVIELIKRFNIQAKDLVVSEAWDTGVIKALRHTTDTALTDLGFGANWKPGLAVASEGVAQMKTTVGGQQIDIYALGHKHAELKTALTDTRGKKVDSKKFDSASFLYIMGNESSPSRVAVMGDLRGADITAMHDGLGADGFSAAFKNVRAIQGLGHHFSQTAGREAGDLHGIELLLQATLHQNNELVLHVQSTETFAFKGPPTMVGPEGALLRYLVRQGVKVVFYGKAAGDPSTAVTDSNLQVDARGRAIRVFRTNNPTINELYRRLEMLREAHKAVKDSQQFGPESIGHAGRDPVELGKALEGEIATLEASARELQVLAGRELLEARGEQGELAKYDKAHPETARTEVEIMNDIAKQGAVEKSLSPEVRARLAAAIASGKPMSVYVEFGATPREVLDAIDKLPEPQRKAIAEKYRELEKLTASLEGSVVPDAQRLDVLTRAKALQAELRAAIPKPGDHPALDTELARLDLVVEKLESETVKDTVLSRDVEGRRIKTQYIKMRANELILKGFDAFGRTMGAVMVVHSIEEMGMTGVQALAGDAGIPETVLGLAHGAYGVNLGLRLVRGVKVSQKEFAIMAVLEIGIAAARDYETDADRNDAIKHAAIRGATNVAAGVIGEQVMLWSATRIHHPVLKLVGMGLGLAIMFGGDRFLELIGVTEKSHAPPKEITDVGTKLEPLLDDYKIMIGAQRLSQRSGDELAALGSPYGHTLRGGAEFLSEERAPQLADKEKAITTAFEEAYAKAKGSWFGLQYLDEKATQFLRMRGEATQGVAKDPTREELDKRWRAMDTKVAFADPGGADVENLEQWNELSRKLDAIDKVMQEDAAKIDRQKAYTLVESAHGILENARYRLDSATRGGLRPGAILNKDSAGYAKYIEKLATFEKRLAQHYQQLAKLGGAADAAITTEGTFEPRVALDRLRVLRKAYDAQVAKAAGLMPDLAKRETWAKPAVLVAKLEEANRTHKTTFDQLKLLELLLQSSGQQAKSAVLLAREPVDPTLAKLIDEQVAAIGPAVESRRYDLGLVHFDELEAIFSQQAVAEDKTFAAEIDAAFPASQSCGPAATQIPSLTEYEVRALQSGKLYDENKRMSSTEVQLGKVREIMMGWRTGEPGGVKESLKMMLKGKWDDYRYSRTVDRQYAVLHHSFRQWDGDAWVKKRDWRSYDESRTAIVAVLETHMSTSSLVWGVYRSVMAVNPDAVAILGTGKVDINARDMTGITEEGILEYARGMK